MPLVISTTYVLPSRLLPIEMAIAGRPGSPDPLVLIVEDDLDTRHLYRDYLTLCGFRTIDAHNGHQALEKARELRPDVVLTDLAVPGMDGFEFGRALQQSAATRGIPVVAVTGHSEYLDQPQRFQQAGISKVFIKPCPPDVIVEQLRRLLGVGAPSQSASG
jgi:two-component system, cell cycle response regulator DivK